MNKLRIYQILDVARPGDKLSRIFDVFILSLIALNVLAVVLETVQSIHAQSPAAFWYFEVISVVVFSGEYILRVWSCTADSKYAHPIAGRLRFIFTPMALVDLLAVMPFYLTFVTIDLRLLRAARLFRVFRVMKMGRYSQALRLMGRVVANKREELVVSVLVMMLLLLIAATLMYYAEQDAQPDAFSSIPAAMWWAVATLTTVGYGDIYPITAFGRLIGAVVTLLGVGMVALPTGLLGAGFVEQISARKSSTKHCPHCDEDLTATHPDTDLT